MKSHNSERATSSFVGFLAIVTVIVAVVVVSFAVEGPRADPSEPGVAVAMGRYGPTQSLAQRGEADGEWLLYCTRSASQCRRRARHLCGGSFEATTLPPTESGWQAVGQGWAFRGGHRNHSVDMTLQEWLDNPDLRQRQSNLIGFRAGNRIVCTTSADS